MVSKALSLGELFNQNKITFSSRKKKVSQLQSKVIASLGLATTLNHDQSVIRRNVRLIREAACLMSMNVDLLSISIEQFSL